MIIAATTPGNRFTGSLISTNRRKEAGAGTVFVEITNRSRDNSIIDLKFTEAATGAVRNFSGQIILNEGEAKDRPITLRSERDRNDKRGNLGFFIDRSYIDLALNVLKEDELALSFIKFGLFKNQDNYDYSLKLSLQDFQAGSGNLQGHNNFGNGINIDEIPLAAGAYFFDSKSENWNALPRTTPKGDGNLFNVGRRFIKFDGSESRVSSEPSNIYVRGNPYKTEDVRVYSLISNVGKSRRELPAIVDTANSFYLKPDIKSRIYPKVSYLAEGLMVLKFPESSPSGQYVISLSGDNSNDNNWIFDIGFE